MLYENWLHTKIPNLNFPECPPLSEQTKTDFLVIGGGIAGLHSALRLLESGKKVVLLEKRMCGSSSSGQSAGFLTPESEEDMSQLIKKHGIEKAKIIYQIPLDGVNLIINTIKKNNFNCDLRKQDSLYLSIKKSHDSRIEEEQQTREELDMPYEILDAKKIKKYHPGIGYTKGLKYSGSYGINSFVYCQELKSLLIRKGVFIFEESEVHKIYNNIAITHLGSVKFENAIICADKLKKEFNEEWSNKYYHIQTYLAISEPLSNKEMNSLFPQGELMCWDTRWDYGYYRPIYGNRLLIGASSPWSAYYPKYYHNPRIIKKGINLIKKRFPEIRDVRFTNYWSGLIDVSKDLTPIVDYDKNNKSIQYVMGCAGLNWAAYCGDYAARRILYPKKIEDLSEFLGSNRKFHFSNLFQTIFGKRITFAISHLLEHLK
jgi:gamma-glutamylputrescine oxidase